MSNCKMSLVVLCVTRATLGLAVLAGWLLCTASTLRANGFGVCEGEGCTEPCPAENACETDTDCDPGMICQEVCDPVDCPVCVPSHCSCDPLTDTWGCTRDCVGLCVPAPMPTVSEWGLIVMALLLLAAGTICVRRRNDLRIV